MSDGVLWVVEVFYEGKWEPTEGIWATRREAKNCPHGGALISRGYKVRVVKYVRNAK